MEKIQELLNNCDLLFFLRNLYVHTGDKESLLRAVEETLAAIANGVWVKIPWSIGYYNINNVVGSHFETVDRSKIYFKNKEDSVNINLLINKIKNGSI